MTNIENNLIPFPKVSIVDSEKLFDLHFEVYNAQQSYLRDQLRYTHKTLFSYLLKALNYELGQNIKNHKEKFQINPEEEIGIHTNRSRLGDFMKCSPETVGNLISRLIQAGVLRKIGHGPVRDFELFISPKLLKFYDSSAEFLKIKNLANSSLSEGQTKTLNMFWLFKQEHFNKKISLVDKESNLSKNAPAFVSKFDGNVQPGGVHTGTLTGTGKTGTQGDFCKSAAETQYLNKLAKQEQNFRRAAAAWALIFINFAFDRFKLWDDRKDNKTVYQAEREAVTLYVQENYFQNCQSQKELEFFFNQYVWRLEKIANYRKRHGWDCQFPRQFFDLNNKMPGSFHCTEAWWKRNQDYQKLKRKRKELMTDHKKLQKALLMVFESNNNFQQARAYIEHVAPHLRKDFMTHVANQNYLLG